MAETDGKNGAPASPSASSAGGTPAGSNGDGKNGKGKMTALLEGGKVVRERAAEELKALKRPEKTSHSFICPVAVIDFNPCNNPNLDPSGACKRMPSGLSLTAR